MYVFVPLPASEVLEGRDCVLLTVNVEQDNRAPGPRPDTGYVNGEPNSRCSCVACIRQTLNKQIHKCTGFDNGRSL